MARLMSWEINTKLAIGRLVALGFELTSQTKGFRLWPFLSNCMFWEENKEGVFWIFRLRAVSTLKKSLRRYFKIPHHHILALPVFGLYSNKPKA